MKWERGFQRLNFIHATPSWFIVSPPFTLRFTSPRLFALLTAYTKSTVCLDMTFDDDTKLFGLMRRYSDLEEADELKRQVVEYVRTQIHDVNAEIEQFKTQSATQETTQAEG